jgi:hypothetical protein
MSSGANDFAQASLPGQKPVITSLMKDFTAEALEQLRFWLEQNPPAVPIQQVLGFSQFLAQRVFVSAFETTTSTSFTNLTTAGPSITGLSDGKYLIITSALINVGPTGADAVAFMAPSANGAAADETQGALMENSTTSGHPRATLFGATLMTLNAGGNNTVTAKYKTSLASTYGGFQYRSLIALKYANV